MVSFSSPQRVVVPSGFGQLQSMFCGCGDPDAAWGEVLKELERLVAVHKQGFDKQEAEPERSGLWYILAYLLDFVGLTEHGSTIHYAWLTDEGTAALEFLQKYGLLWQEDNQYDFYWIDGRTEVLLSSHAGGE